MTQLKAQAAEPPLCDADPFSPEALRVAPDAAAVGVKREVLTVPIRKPDRQDFHRVRPDEPGQDWHLDTVVLELREDRETYLVAPTMREKLVHFGLHPKGEKQDE